ncbi:histidine phosphatase family protein [Paludibacterium paludis]|uniref:phosphoglycerate mutase (2,3-diphosphoglycerate-dependent) n=1 Tax=Paludibacterium paludis TaxID=1225769 RepID=A0A918P5A4_9NEIS|nr:histidine phosphatase family protein [Paludibacterium paludis]GGY25072.1 phosphoglycerate mutase [Paludibacterium paludis]
MNDRQKVRVCMVRHGETAWNAERRLQGQTDIPLNITGEEQAERLARTLRHQGLSFDAVYSSDLSRALATARPVAQWQNLPLNTAPALRERHFGLFQGLTYEEAAERHPEAYARYARREPDFTPENGESLLAFQARVTGFMHACARQHPGQTLFIVCHGGVLDIAYRLATGMELSKKRDFTIPNAALNWLEYANGSWRLERWGDESHLAESLDEL